MPLPPRRRRQYAYLLIMMACVVVMTGVVLVELDEPSDSDTDTDTSTESSDTSTESSDLISTVCPLPARKRKRGGALKSDENAKQSFTSYQARLPARKRVKTGGDSKKAMMRAETSSPSKRRVRRMKQKEFETDIAESIEAVSEAIKVREGWNKDGDRFDEWSSKLTKVLLESTDRYKSCLARLENGYDLEARWQAVEDSFGFERTLKLCDTSEGGSHVEEWAEAVAKSQVLRSRQLEPRKLSALDWSVHSSTGLLREVREDRAAQ